MEAEVLWIASIELPLEGDIVICHPQQFAVLQFIFIDERAVARGVRVLLIEFRKSDYCLGITRIVNHTRSGYYTTVDTP